MGFCFLRNKKKNRIKTGHRWGESGNVFFTLFGAVALVGVVGAATTTLMRGPVGTVMKLNQNAKADSQMQIAHKLAMLEASQKANSGDCDSDGYVEPIGPLNTGSGSCSGPVPTGGGCLPDEVGSSKNDPWGTNYGYCAWDHGSITGSGCSDFGNANTDVALAGTNAQNKVTIAIISAGPDRAFQTQCGADPNYVTATTSPNDDIILDITYSGAIEASGGLWALKSGDPETATIDKDIEVGGQARLQSGGDFAGDFSLQNARLEFLGNNSLLLLPDEVASGACNTGNQGALRRNTAGGTQEVIEVCDFDNTGGWSNTATSAAGSGAQGNTGDIQYRSSVAGAFDAEAALNYNAGTDTLSVPNATLTGTLSTLDINVTGNIADSGGNVTINDALDIVGNTDITGTLTVSGATDINNSLEANSATITTGGLTVSGGGIDVNAGNTDLLVTDVQGAFSVGAFGTTLGGTLTVAGDINDSNGAVTFNDVDGVDISDNLTVGGDADVTGDVFGRAFIGNNAAGPNYEGLYFTSSGLYLQTEGNKILEIDAAGDVGIGLSGSPTAQLDVNGEIRLRSAGYVAGNNCGSLHGALSYSSGDQFLVCSSLTDQWETIGTSGGGGGGIGGVWTDEGIYIRYENSSYITDAGTALNFSSALEGAGTRLIWHTDNKALRAGTVTGTQWDEGNMGVNSAAFGADVMASGATSFAAGDRALATTEDAIALGSLIEARGTASVALGNQAVVAAGATNSMALGLGAPAGASPQVQGANALGLFMGDQSGVNFNTANTMLLAGGKFVIDPNIPATEFAVSLPNLALDVEGDIGAIKYCDENGLNCFLPGDVAAGTAPGANTEVVFNSGGVLGTDTGFVFLSASNRLGLGVAVPAAQIEIAEQMLLGNVNDCTAETQGALRLNATGDVLEMCDFAGSAGYISIGGAAVNAPGNDREIVFNSGGELDTDSNFKLMADSDLLLTGTYTGTASVPASGAGTRMFFDTQKATFRVGGVSGTEWDNGNTGNYSVAMGRDVTASGNQSVSMGFSNTASGDNSFAMGRGVSAGGDYSIAFGRRIGIDATGDASTTFGLTTANPTVAPNVSGAQSFSVFMGDQSGVTFSAANTVGFFGGKMVIDPAVPATNLVADTALEIEGTLKIASGGEACDASREGGIRYISATDTFEFCALAASGWESVSLGAGTLDGLSDTNIASIADDQFLRYDSASGKWVNETVSIADLAAPGADREIVFNSGGEMATDSNFKLMADGDFLLTGTYTGTASVPVTGAGTRMFFDTQKAAFRAGTVTNNEWDDANIGAESVAFGRNTIALGPQSTAIGWKTIASGRFSTAIGSQVAAGDGVTAGGPGDGSMAIGLIDNAVTITTPSQVTGTQSLGIFIDDQDGLVFASNNTMGLFGGTMVIDPKVPATQLYARGVLDLGAATDAVVLPAGTTAQQPAAVNGMLRYNTDNGKFEGYQAGAWQDILTSAVAGGASAPDRGIQFNSGGDFVAVANFTYTSTGHLGVGLPNPDDELDVVGTAEITGNVVLGAALDVTGQVSFASGLDVADATVLGGTLSVAGDISDPDSDVTIADGLNVTGAGDFDTTLNVDGAATYGSTLRIGSGAPQTRLDLDGTLKIASGGEACDASREGGIRYISATDTFEFCALAASGWEAVGLGAGTLEGLSDTNIASLQDNEFLRYDSASGKWVNETVSIADLAAPGADREIVFNSGGEMATDSNFKLMADGDFLLTGTYTGTASVPVSGAGTRMFFDTQKAAFRAGYVGGAHWDNANVGNYSMAMGRSTIASGSYSMATGYVTTASGSYSTATGIATTASGHFSTAMGYRVVAGNGTAANGLGDGSFALGLIDDAVTITVNPQVTGIQSMGIFMDDQDGLVFASNNTMGLFGGTMVIDPKVPATQLYARGVLDLGAATDAVVLPAGTTAQQPAAVNGMLRYNTDNGKFEGYQAGAWQDILTSAVAGGASAPDRGIQFNSGGDFTAVANFTYTSTGHLGVGLPNPDDELDVVGTAEITGNVVLGAALDVTGQVSFASGLDVADATVLGGTLSVAGDISDPDSDVTIADGLNVTGAGDFDTTLNVDGAATYGSTLRIGSGAPQTRLDLDGTLKIASGGEACDASREGGIRYISATDTFEFCALAASGWEAVGLGAGTLDGLSDTNIASIADDQFLRYDSASGKWVNEAVTLADMAAVGNDTELFFNNGGVIGSDTGLVFISAGNNLGIGVAVPDDQLDVAGTAQITGATVLGSTLGVTGVASFTDDVRLKDGSAADPALTFTSDQNTGLYGDGADLLGFATAGVERLRLGHDGLISFTSTGAVVLPVGTTAQQPMTAANGMLRYNTTNGKFEGYQAGAWQDILTSAVAGGASAPDRGIQFNSGGDFAADAKFTYTADGDLIVGSNQIDDTTTGTEDSRMYFDVSNSAFRAGSVTGNQWDFTSAGQYSAAFGQDTIASGTHSFAAGWGATASGTADVALGEYVTANGGGKGSVALGYYATASGQSSVAIGRSTLASGDGSVAMGYESSSLGSGSTSLGKYTTARGNSSIATGNSTVASGFSSTALGAHVTAGDGTAGSGFGDGSMAIGLIDNAVPITTAPQVTGIQSMGIFMGDQDGGVVLADQNTMGLFGGAMVIDPAVPATNLSADTALEVEGTFKLAYGGEACDASREGGIRYVSATDTFEFCALAASGWESVSLGAGTLEGLSDTNIASLQDNEFLRYDSASGKWVNETVSIADLAAPGNDRDLVFNSGGALSASSTYKLMADGDLLLTGTYTGTASVPVTGAGTRMFFDTQTAAFRSGKVSFAQWDDVNIGLYSIAMGQDTVASGQSSFAMGETTTASGYNSFSIGLNTTASGDYSYSTGLNTIAAGDYSAAFGREVNIAATGDGSVAFGLNTAGSATDPIVSGAQSFALFMGNHSTVNFASSNTMGLFGGTMVIDPKVPATQLYARGVLDLGAATDAVVLPAGTTAQQPAAVNGMLRYNTDNGKFEGYQAGAWQDILTSAVAGGASAPDRGIQFNSGGDFVADGNFVYDSAGNLAIGSVSAAVRLDVEGTLKIASGGEACDASREGGIRYVSAIDTFEFCALAASGWEAVGLGAGTLEALSDTNIASLQDNQFLRYDSASGKWVNETVSIADLAAPGNDREILFNSGGSLETVSDFVFDSAGKLAIGTMSAAVRLDVAGTIRLADGGETCAAGLSGAMKYSGGAMYLCNGSDWIAVNTGSGGRWLDGVDSGDIYYSSGFVGIGTNDPQVSLHVNATDAVMIPSGNEGDRPSSPVNGMIRYNSNTEKFEAYQNSAWVNLTATDAVPYSLPPSLVAQGAETANATSFNLDPQALGASDGDTMVVVSMWEADSAVTSPAGWTTLINQNTTAPGVAARMIVDTITFSGAPSSSETWSYGSTLGVAYAYTILSGSATLGAVTLHNDSTNSIGATSIPFALGTNGTLVYALADSGSEVNETASFTAGVTSAARDTTPVNGRAALVGYANAAGSAAFTTSAIVRKNFQGISIPLGGVTRQVFFNDGGVLGKSDDFVYTSAGDLIVTGTYTGTSSLETAGAGSKMFFHPSMAAFRAGRVTGNQWDSSNIGTYSTAMGYNTTSSGDSSFATGLNATSSGIASFAAGHTVTATGLQSMVMGYNSTSSGAVAFAFGEQSTSSGDWSAAIGTNNTTSGISAMALGYNNHASGIRSMALGSHVIAGNGTPGNGLGDGSMAIGLIDNGVTITTSPKITGIQSVGIFMGDQDGGVDLSAANTMGLFGGKMVIDPAVPATRLAAKGVIDVGAATDAIILPKGTDAQRPASPESGMIRFSSTSNTFEGHNGTTWGSLGGSGGGATVLDDLTDSFTDYTDGIDNLIIGNPGATALAAGAARNLFIGNTAGDAAMTSSTSATDFNIGIGHDALNSLTTGDSNVAIGMKSISYLTTGTNNTAIGTEALKYTRVASNNTAIGHETMIGSGTPGNNTWTNNTAIGYKALGYSGGTGTTGSRNVAVGAGTGDTVTSGADNILIGYNIEPPTASTSNHLNIGNTIYGDLSGKRIGIGNIPASGVELDVTGDIQYTGTITDVSDMRLKKDIKPLGNMLDKIGQVKTYSFVMKDDEAGRTEFGVMAQELETIFPALVHTAKDERGTKSVNYVGLIAPIIEATQELRAENESLRAEVAVLKAERDLMRASLENISRDVAGLKAHTGYGTDKAMIGLGMLGGMAGAGGVIFLIGRRRNRR